jgi:hypothetical protein
MHAGRNIETKARYHAVYSFFDLERTMNVIACAGYSDAMAGDDKEIAIVAAASDFLMVDPPC